jgi:hypothetical protein
VSEIRRTSADAKTAGNSTLLHCPPAQPRHIHWNLRTSIKFTFKSGRYWCLCLTDMRFECCKEQKATDRSHRRINTGKWRMTGITTRAVRFGNLRFGNTKISGASFCWAECTTDRGHTATADTLYNRHQTAHWHSYRRCTRYQGHNDHADVLQNVPFRTNRLIKLRTFLQYLLRVATSDVAGGKGGA